MSHDANDTNVGPSVPSAGVEDTSQVVDAKVDSRTWVVDIEIDRGVTCQSVAEHGTRHADTLDDRRFGAMFLDGANSFTFDCRNIRRDTNIGA